MLAIYHKALQHIFFSFVIIFTLLNADVAYAQTHSCSALKNTARSLERNRDFRSLAKNTKTIQRTASELKKVERQFVRSGCQKILNAKKRLTGQCRTLARKIIRGRSDINKLKAKVGTGQAIARQRENILKQLANNTCSNSNNNFNSIQNKNKNLFDILFGNNNNIITTEIPNVRIDLNTLRTLCVRSSDGYYWPISFSTTEQYLSLDAAACAEQANGHDVELYYHKNPGQEADDMINMAGIPYKSMPNAFLFRSEFIQNNIFKRQKSSGFFEVVENKANGQSRTMIMFEEQGFPMPIRDPRQKIKTTVAKAIFVPLPRNRPYREGEPRPKQIVATPKITAPIQTFISNGKTIRIIGPDTLYAQSTPTGS